MWGDTSNTLNETGGGFFGQPNELDTSVKKDTQRRNDTIVPLFIRMIKESHGDEFTYFGTPVRMVVIVGVLREYDVQSTRATYEIEDHSGRLSCIYWLDSDSDTSPILPPVKLGSFVRVTASLRNKDGEKLLMVTKMEPVDSPNEITTHMLEVIQTRYEYESTGTSNTSIRVNNPGADLANSMSFMTGDHGNQMGLTKMQEQVMNILKKGCKTQEGMSRKEVLKNFPPAQHREVATAITYLTDEGLAYTTIDDDHFTVTDAI